MNKFFNRLEKYLIRFVVLGLVIMVVVQGMMTHEQYRLFLSWGEKMEGETLNYPVSVEKQVVQDDVPQVNSPHTEITISIDKFSSLPKAIILVNGQETKNFSTRDVRIQVMAGDVIEIDSRPYNFPVDYHITNTSENIAYPQKEQQYTGNQSMVMVGKVIVK